MRKKIQLLFISFAMILSGESFAYNSVLSKKLCSFTCDNGRKGDITGGNCGRSVLDCQYCAQSTCIRLGSGLASFQLGPELLYPEQQVTPSSLEDLSDEDSYAIEVKAK